MRCLAVLCTLLAALSGVAFGKIVGATIQSVTCEGNTSTVVIFNQSDKDITGYSLAMAATLSGSPASWEHVEDYGPMLTAAGKALHPKESATIKQTFDGTGQVCTKIEARLVVAIYQDQTAEVEGGSDHSFEHTVAERGRIAKALRIEADTLAASLSQPNPSADARLHLQQQLGEARDRAAQSGGEGDTEQSYLESAIAMMKSAPQASEQEREFVQRQAARLQSEASAFATYAQVRRGQ